MTFPGNPRADPIAIRIAEIRDQLGAAITLREETVSIPGSDESLLVMRPVDTDLLLDLAVEDPEQNLPYWSELWPSGIALAAAILDDPGVVRGQEVLELGCGVGITAAIAAAAGANLLATDYSPESLLLASIACLRHAGIEPRTMRLNWRKPPDGLLAGHPHGYPVVLAADVLYERRDIEPLLELFGRIVAPGGVLWLAEPGRPPASIFLETASRRGWTFSSATWNGPWPDPNDVDVIARVHQLRRK